MVGDGLGRCVGVLGAGAWGTALARHLCVCLGQVRLWAYEPEVAASVNQRHLNALYLPNVILPPGIWATSDLAAFAEGLSLLLVVVPSHVLRSVMQSLLPYLPSDVVVMCATKGIESGSLMTMHEVLLSVLGVGSGDRLSYLSGPSFALDVARGKATAVSLASDNAELCASLQSLISNESFRAYTTHDVIGVSLGGALKNVIAIAAGATSGLGLGHNATAALVTRGLAEMTRMCMTLGGEALTLSGLSGMGDLVLTCYGELSRNRELGYRLGCGESFEAIQSARVTVAEGVKTAQSAYALARRHGIDMPITQRVYEGLYESKSPGKVFRELMERELKQELEFSVYRD